MGIIVLDSIQYAMLTEQLIPNYLLLWSMLHNRILLKSIFAFLFNRLIPPLFVCINVSTNCIDILGLFDY